MGSNGYSRRTDNEIKNYWNTRIKRRQRAGLPLYPPELERKIALMNQRQGFMLLQSQARSKNLVSQFPPTANTLFNSVSANNYATKYFLENFDPSLQSRQPQSPHFNFKMEQLPSNQTYHNYISHQKLQPQLPPSLMGQGNDAFFDNLSQEAHGSGELFNNELVLYEQLPTSCTTIMDSLPLSMPPPTLSLPSNTKYLSVDSLGRLRGSDISIGLPAMKQSIETVINQNISNPIEMNPIQQTAAQPQKTFDWFDSSSQDERKLDMQPFNPNFTLGNEWNFDSSAWEENLSNIR
ncbi:Transcription factor GAMYB [Dendrobium catenatum]|uniref:Transcription factor GAMYB n=1 Tax=Dendrobium catenatum TaxID=906689 RepID=A0A2I0VQ40_9ASPA|nr:Transcription factor GAMYB [Dendrobium catenatum]